jgi:hypothetical protein
MKPIGTLRREYGYNGFKPIKKGTLIYGDTSRCFFIRTTLQGDEQRLYFNTKTLQPDIQELQSTYYLQELDTNCNDCKHMVRDLVEYEKHNELYKNTRPSYRLQYGMCLKKNKLVSFIPVVCMPQNSECFTHRKNITNDSITID